MRVREGDRREKRRRAMSGFTLIEIMVVVMIIGLLASLVGVRVYQVYGGAQRKAAKAQISKLASVLDLYYLDNKTYPTTAQGLDALVHKPSGNPAPKNYPAGGYIDEVPLDPWGNPYVYQAPGADGRPYTIESYGADAADGGEGDNADIESWNMQKD